MRRSISTVVVCSVGWVVLGSAALAEDEELNALGAKASAAAASDAQAEENAQVGASSTKEKGGKADGKKKNKKDDSTHTVEVKTTLNLRDKPQLKDSKIIASLPNGTPVKVLDKSKQPWWKATAKGKTGYLWYGYLRDNKKGKKGSGKSSEKGKAGTGSGSKSGTGTGSGSGSPTGSPAGGNAGNPNGTGPVNTAGLSGLRPGFRAKVERILRRLQSLGWQPRMAEGRRTLAQQREKVRKGYSKTMNSYHLLGLAADIIDKRYAWNIPQSHKFWKDLGAAAAAENLTWGGNWRSFKDVAHVQARSRSDN